MFDLSRHEGKRMACGPFSKFLLLGMVFISGCAYPISRELREEARENLTFSSVFQNPTAYTGAIVIWGGTIISTLNRPAGTEVTVLEIPLDSMERPEAETHSHGRFIAKVSKFLDPAIYRPGRGVTVAGEIIGKETQPLGEITYTYPVIVIKQIYLWRQRSHWIPPGYYWPTGDWPYYPFWPYGW
jgi:outer membrane lipoprotein